MKWIKTDRSLDIEDFRRNLPLNKPFLCLWKGVICLCEYDQDIDRFFIGMMPISYLGFWKLDIEREKKITHYMILDLPEDY